MVKEDSEGDVTNMMKSRHLVCFWYGCGDECGLNVVFFEFILKIEG